MANTADADRGQHRVEIWRKEVRLRRVSREISPGRRYYDRRAVAKCAYLACWCAFEGAANAHDVINPRLERGRHGVVVDGSIDQEGVRLIEFLYQLFRKLQRRDV